MELYIKIQTLRKNKNLTQSQLAEKLDVTRQAVQKWESGITSPDITKLPELASILGVSVDTLLNADITEEELIKELSHFQDKQNEEKNSTPESKNNKSRRSMLDYMLMIPFGLGVCIVIFMFYFVGGMMVGMLFFTSLASLLSIIFSFIAIFINFNNGSGAILVCIAGIFIGAGMVVPLYYAAKWWMRKFIKLSGRLFVKIKSINLRSFL